jgi:hypothetical protein
MKTKILLTIFSFVLCLGLSTNSGAEEQWIKVAGGTWEPSPKMLSEIKSKIESHVKKYATAQGRELKNWQSYTFQYQGIEEKGQKLIFINALCDNEIKKRDLSKQIIHVFDGGSCFFSFKYDPLRNDLFDLVINGEA